MKKIQKVNRWNLLIGYIYPILFSAFCIIFYVYDETSDDMGAAWNISQSHHATPVYVNKVLALLIRRLYLKIPIVSWWPAFLVFANLLALLMICHIAVKKADTKAELAFAVSVITVSANLVFFSGINYTRTSIALASVSVWYLLDALKRKYIADKYFSIGLIGILVGGGIRLQGAILAIGLLGILFFLFNGLALKQILQAAVIFFAIITSIKCTDFLLLDKEERSYREWEDARVRIFDYQGLLPKYEDNKDFYLENGISDINFQIIEKRNMPEDWDVYSYEHIKAIGDNGSLFLPLRTAMLMTRNCVQFSPKIWLWCILTAVLSLIVSDNIYRILTILCLLIGRTVIFILALLGRIPVRISDGVAFVLIVYLTYSILDGVRLKQNKIENRRRQLIYLSVYIAVFAFSARTLHLNYKDCFLRTTIIHDVGSEEKKRLRDTLEEIGSRKENIYLLSCRGGVPSLSETGAFRFFQHIPDDFTSNIYYLFGGQIRQPYHINELKAAGINNPMRALFEKDNVYSDYDEEVLLYLKSNYGEDIEMKIVEEINGYQIVKYYRSE